MNSIIGIDPSSKPHEHAWAQISPSGQLMGFGMDFRQWFTSKRGWLTDVMVCIEMIVIYAAREGSDSKDKKGRAFRGTSQSVVDTAVEIGRLIELVDTDMECSLRRLTRSAIRSMLTGAYNANDTMIRAAVKDLYGGKDATKKGQALHGVKDDIWQALACAHAARLNITRKSEWYVPTHERNGI